MFEKVISIISILVSFVAAYISMKAYKRDTPKLNIQIRRPEYDCFFGDAEIEYNNKMSQERISGVRFRIVNNSAVEIEVNEIVLRIKKEEYRLISKNNPCWECVSFMNYDKEENEIVPDVNFSINYLSQGIDLPCSVKPYASVPCVALFYHFPSAIRGKVRAKLRINTAAGMIQKKVVLFEYDHTFSKEELEDVERYYRSK